MSKSITFTKQPELKTTMYSTGVMNFSRHHLDGLDKKMMISVITGEIREFTPENGRRSFDVSPVLLKERMILLGRNISGDTAVSLATLAYLIFRELDNMNTMSPLPTSWKAKATTIFQENGKMVKDYRYKGTLYMSSKLIAGNLEPIVQQLIEIVLRNTDSAQKVLIVDELMEVYWVD